MSEWTFGVEEEFILVDADTGRLAAQAAAVRHGADASGSDDELQLELTRYQVEIASPVCTTADQLSENLTRLRGRLAASARERNLHLLATGTAVLAEPWPPPLAGQDRYQVIAERFGGLIDTLCGCHVHVAIPDAEFGIKLSNHLRPWLPLLLALSANSPFSRGQDSGHASWRHVTWARWPSAGPPPFFESAAHYEASVSALLHVGAALDRKMIYWDIRLSEAQPTLEFRVCDVAATVEEAVLLGVLVRALAQAASHDLDTGVPAKPVPHEVLRAALWRAARDGLGGYCPDPESGALLPVSVVLRRARQRLRPFLLDNGELELVEELTEHLCTVGGGAHRQRQAMARRGEPMDVVDLLARQTTVSSLLDSPS
ncbi:MULTISPECIES: glutamate--cysteine ligase [unclassified Crossiella]|uniref:carboxylate-amine ligase n=1 Tax=unclassified Crossiella TaxID=2620835 RepID=UPI001FFFE4F0|nr:MULTISPECIES: glutamate--cysteine ligase [unclassified Crossiella]MCK2239927.1 glutamate--cysteine ligase [Crossiella sp. S99.2]MCK2252635.1 glutamate--cysteine ligase [Crossiella sp. S99.1]